MDEEQVEAAGAPGEQAGQQAQQHTGPLRQRADEAHQRARESIEQAIDELNVLLQRLAAGESNSMEVLPVLLQRVIDLYQQQEALLDVQMTTLRYVDTVAQRLMASG